MPYKTPCENLPHPFYQIFIYDTKIFDNVERRFNGFENKKKKSIEKEKKRRIKKEKQLFC